MISAILLAVYIDELLPLLRQSKLGCHVDKIFMGAQIFADDIFLLSGNVSGLQEMVNICAEFASRKNLKFGTHMIPAKSKTKCIIFSNKKKDLKISRNIFLYGNPLPWVSHVKHLGNTLQNDNSMRIDVAIKRGASIGKVNSLLQEFHNIVPDLLIKLVNSFATSLTGSSVWDLTSKECEQLYRSWNVTVRNVFKLNRTTHRNLIEPFSDTIEDGTI